VPENGIKVISAAVAMFYACIAIDITWMSVSVANLVVFFVWVLFLLPIYT